MRRHIHHLPAITGIALCLCLVAGAATAAEREPGESRVTTVVTPPPPRSVTVEGEGEVEAIPDIAEVGAGVTARAETARKALDASNAAMARLMAALRAASIAERDIRTDSFSVAPIYERAEHNASSHITAYDATNQVTVTIRNLNRVGTVLDSMVTAGSNRLQGIRFRIAQPDTLLDQARNKAFEDARRRAKLYAGAAGAKLGKVLRITEQATRLPQPRMYAAGAPSAARAVPISRGAQVLDVTVTVEFALE